MSKNNEEKGTTSTEQQNPNADQAGAADQEPAAQVDTQESTYSGPVKDCTACNASGLNLEDRSKLCDVCNGSGLVPDKS